MKKLKFTFSILLLIFCTSLFAEIQFQPVAINDENRFLFESTEIIGGNPPLKTLFYGKLEDQQTKYQAMSVYPENFVYFKSLQKIFIQNRIGLFSYDIMKNKIQEVGAFPGLTKKNEYSISQILKAAISPNNRYILGKIPISPSRSNIILYDLADNKQLIVVKDVETLPGSPVGLWSVDSNFFIYQKNEKLYYFSLSDYKKDILLTEEWRIIGRAKLKNAFWTNDNHLVWIEKNLIFRGDPYQFYYRSIYKSYLRQGEIIGKIPFEFDPSFDSFVYNEKANRFFIVKDGVSIFYYSLTHHITQNPYIQLNDHMRYDRSVIMDNGEGIISVDILANGIVNKRLYLVKKTDDDYIFHPFLPAELKNTKIYDFTLSQQDKIFVLNTEKGAFAYHFDQENPAWSYNNQAVLQAVQIFSNTWILGGNKTTVMFDTSGKTTPLFASSFDNAGFFQGNIVATIANQKYIINNQTKSLSTMSAEGIHLSQLTKNNNYRLLSREIRKGFYQQSVYLKELYTGKLIDITGEPELYYQLYQPELELEYDFYQSPLPEKYELTLLFDCIKTAEGIFPILQSLNQFQIPANFFINGTFMDINPIITTEISRFNVEVGNMFQYYVNLTRTDFLIDKNFIRQGLSSNEEKYFKLTGKNFAPYWHSPNYAANEKIIKFGQASGYQYVSFHLDSYDWVNKDNRELQSHYYMNTNELIKRILTKLKPGQVIIFNTGKNYTLRDDWLFNNMDILITELIRSGYSFTVVSDLMKKYRY
ncbi:MAG: polysaccharide deacetylase family protein [Spirochaetes bacterium]|nr:polysaccharide deacetylase family protein [Spirochaetota bacterium]